MKVETKPVNLTRDGAIKVIRNGLDTGETTRMPLLELRAGHYSVLRYLGNGWQEGMPEARPYTVYAINKKWMPDLQRYGLATWDGTIGRLTRDGMAVLAQHRKDRPKLANSST